MDMQNNNSCLLLLGLFWVLVSMAMPNKVRIRLVNTQLNGIDTNSNATTIDRMLLDVCWPL